jgi:ribosomal protein S14
MLFLKIKDLKLRKKYYKIEKTRNINKFTLTILSNLQSTYKTSYERKCFFFLLEKYKLNFSRKTKIVRRCLSTGRSRGNTRRYNITGSLFRKLNYFGLIPGVKKAIW